MYSVVNILTEIVAKTNQKLGLTYPKLMIKFEEGTVTEIRNIADNESRGDGSYPLIWLVTGYAQDYDTDFRCNYSTNIQLFYVEQAKTPTEKSKNINTAQIESDMFPVVETFLKLLSVNKYVNNREGQYAFDVNFTEHPYFGRLDGQKNRFNQECVAIEIEIKDLEVNYEKCS